MRNNVRAVIHRQKPMNIYPIQPHPPKNPHTKTKDPRKNPGGPTKPRPKPPIQKSEDQYHYPPPPKISLPQKTPAKKPTPAEAGICPQAFFILIHAVSNPRQDPATEKPRLTVDTYSYTPHRYYTFPDTPNK